MKVILQEDVRNLGKSGDVLEVKDGFARNYLLPRNLAVKATTRNMRVLAHQKQMVSHKISKRQKEVVSLRESLENRSITVPKAVGKDDKLYGSVTVTDIEKALLDENIRVDRKRIVMGDPIKSLGVHPVKVALDSNSEVEIKVWVVAK
jgi:large subunit ribosomal protein L9